MPTTTLCVERIDDYERHQADGFIGLCLANGMLDSLLQSQSHSIKTRRRRGA